MRKQYIKCITEDNFVESFGWMPKAMFHNSSSSKSSKQKDHSFKHVVMGSYWPASASAPYEFSILDTELARVGTG